MKIIPLMLFIGGIYSLSTAGTDTSITLENQVILKGAWTPTVEQTAKALKAIQEFLKQPKGVGEREKREIKYILANSSKYRVQFTGRMSDSGRKVIQCNFFPNRKDAFPDWKKHKVEVDDGGFWFWRIEYDVDNGVCHKFSSNGYA